MYWRAYVFLGNVHYSNKIVGKSENRKAARNWTGCLFWACVKKNEFLVYKELEINTDEIFDFITDESANLVMSVTWNRPLAHHSFEELKGDSLKGWY